MLITNTDLHDYYRRRERSRRTSAAAFAVCLAGALLVVLAALLLSLMDGCARQAYAVPVPMSAAVYPEPVCEVCGGVMDGQGCKCKGVGLPVEGGK